MERSPLPLLLADEDLPLERLRARNLEFASVLEIGRSRRVSSSFLLRPRVDLAGVPLFS